MIVVISIEFETNVTIPDNTTLIEFKNVRLLPQRFVVSGVGETSRCFLDTNKILLIILLP